MKFDVDYHKLAMKDFTIDVSSQELIKIFGEVKRVI